MLHFGGFFEVLELSAEMSMYTLVRGEHSKSQQSQNSLLWVRLKVEELGHLRVDENKSFLSYSRRHTAPRSITHTLLLVHSSFQHGPVDGQLSVASPIVGRTRSRRDAVNICLRCHFVRLILGTALKHLVSHRAQSNVLRDNRHQYVQLCWCQLQA